MKVFIVGLGAVGSAIACALHAAGHKVCGIIRPNAEPLGHTSNQNSYREISLKYKNGTYTCRVPTQWNIDDSADLVITTLRAYDTSHVLQHHKRSIQRANVPVVILQNGVGAMDDAKAVFGSLRNIFCAVGLFAVRKSRCEDSCKIEVFAGNFRSILMPNAPIAIEMGCADMRDFETLKKIQSILKHAVDFTIRKDAVGMLWNKFVVNHINAFPAILNKSVQECIRSDEIWSIIQASMREATYLAGQLGVQISAGRLLGREEIAQLIHADKHCVLNACRFRLLHAFGISPNYTSLHSSVVRGEKTEIDYLNGYTAGRLAELQRRRRAPQGYIINSTLASAVLRVSHTKLFLRLPQLISRISQK